MAGGITDTGEQYSFKVGLVFIFNLIVGTGALTMPKAFSEAGWLLSAFMLILLAFMSYLTSTWVTEAMAVANAKLRTKDKANLEPTPVNIMGEDDVLIHDKNPELHPLLSKKTSGDNEKLFDITQRTEMGSMASMFFNKYGLNLFYIIIAVYLYGDLSIYVAAVPKSLRDVVCTYKPYNESANGSAECNVTLTNDDPCWPGIDISRMNAYRIFVAVFTVCLGPLVFFNVQKTKYLQYSTIVLRNVAFILMIVLAIIRLSKKQGQGHPPIADIKGVPNLFGVCVYSFMCHHSLPSLVTPIKDKSKIYPLLFVDYMLIMVFYALLSFTGIFAFGKLDDLYTLNFFPKACANPDDLITNVVFFQYFLALFPVIMLSSTFPIIAITLRNNLKTVFYNENRPFSWSVDRLLFPVAALLPSVAVAFGTSEVEFLVGITGSYAGAGIQYVIPVALVYYARKDVSKMFGQSTINTLKSPFQHKLWLLAVLIWSVICVVFVTVNHIIVGK